MPKELIRKIKAIRWRLQWIDFCRRFLLTLKWTALTLLVYLLVERLFALPLAMEDIAPPAVAFALAALVIWNVLRRVSEFDAAVRADERLDLRERLSSAFLIREPRGEPELAVIDDALRHARAIRTGEVFKPHLSRETRHALWPLAILALAWMVMPQFDLLAKNKERDPNKQIVQPIRVESRRNATDRLEELARELDETAGLRDPLLARELKKELDQLAKEIKEQKANPQKALAKMSDMQDRIAARKSDIEKQLAMPNDMLSKGEGKQTRDLAKALEKGNFKVAAQKLDELKKKMQDGSLSKEEKAALQKEMAAMAASLGTDSPLGKAMQAAAMKMQAGEFNGALAEMELAAGEMLDMAAMLAELSALDSLGYDMEARKLAQMADLCDACKEGKGGT